MNANMGLGRIVTSRRTRFLLTGLVVMAIGAVMLATWSQQRGHAENPIPTRQWPSFTMQFTNRQFDAVTGNAVINETSRLTLVDDYTWRVDVINDSVHPALIGSWRVFKDGQYTTYNAELRSFSQTRPPSGDVIAISRELVPGIYSRVRTGGEPGWTLQASALPPPVTDVVALPKVTFLKQTPDEVDRIDFAANTVNSSPTLDKQRPVGGIPVYAETRMNDKLIHQFVVESLQLVGGLSVAVPTVPANLATPVITQNNLPVVTITSTPGGQGH